MSKPVRFGIIFCLVFQLVAASLSVTAVAALYSQQPLELTIHLDKVTVVSNSTPTLYRAYRRIANRCQSGARHAPRCGHIKLEPFVVTVVSGRRFQKEKADEA